MNYILNTIFLFFNPYFFKRHGNRIFLFVLLLLLGSSFVGIANAQSEAQFFFIERSYDLYGRKEAMATLVRTSDLAYFYVENAWWNTRSAKEQNDLKIALFDLSQEFQNHIYPVLTSTFGAESKPGIDGDNRITVLIHPMYQETGGYFNSGDVYSRLQNPRSNEREMVYLNSDYIGKQSAKSFLAHEFVHVITIQQKDLSRRITEETWLNEARAEYAPTLLGYDNVYEGSNLQRRARDFARSPSDPLTEWLNRKEDYGAVNMFVQYIVDHYGVQILVDSLQSFQVGIPSVNEALRKGGFQKNFADIFTDWAIAVLVNDCSLGDRYCYKNSQLADIRVTPTLYVLPSGETIFSTYHVTDSWSTRWHRLIGGGGNLAVRFSGTGAFQVPYVLCDFQNTCFINFFSLDDKQEGEIVLSKFNKTYSSLTLLSFVEDMGLNQNNTKSSFSWEVSVQNDATATDASVVRELLVRITQLQNEVRQLQAQLAASLVISATEAQVEEQNHIVSCISLDTNLSLGMRNNQVRCLQEFLKIQGPSIYPEGLITGNFLLLTKQAVIRFQEKYAAEILVPVGETRGTGYVGQNTRAKISQLLTGQLGS